MVLEKWAVDQEVRFLATNFYKYKNLEKHQKQAAFISFTKKISNWIFSDKDVSVLEDLAENQYMGVGPESFKSIFNNKDFLKKRINDLIKFP